MERFARRFGLGGAALAIAALAIAGCYGGAGVAIPPADVVPPRVAEDAAAPRPTPRAGEALEVRFFSALAEVAQLPGLPTEAATRLRAALEARGCSFVDPLAEADDELTIRMGRCDSDTEHVGVARVSFIPDDDGVRALVSLDGVELDGAIFDGDATLALRDGNVSLEAWDATARTAGAPSFEPVETSVSYVGPYRKGRIEAPLLEAVDSTFQILFCLARIVALFG